MAMVAQNRWNLFVDEYDDSYGAGSVPTVGDLTPYLGNMYSPPPAPTPPAPTPPAPTSRNPNDFLLDDTLPVRPTPPLSAPTLPAPTLPLRPEQFDLARGGTGPSEFKWLDTDAEIAKLKGEKTPVGLLRNRMTS